MKVLLIEKQNFPRYKPCGGVFSEQAMSYLDFNLPNYMLEKSIFGARVHFNGNAIEKSREHRLSTLVTRSVLDEYLLKKAQETGAEIKMGERVTGFDEGRNGVHVYTTDNKYEAKYLVVAEGAQGKLKNQIRRKDKRDEYGICAVTEIVEASDIINARFGSSIHIHFGVADMGYGWIVPHKDHYSVGIGGLAQDLPNPRRTLQQFLTRNGFNGNCKLKMHTIPAGGIKRRVTSSRVILTGDAAGYVDSFCGEGIAYAIRSGQIAAEVVSRVVNSNERLDALNEYDAICKAEFEGDLKYSLVLAKVMHRFPRTFLNLLVTNEHALDKYLEVSARKRTYKSYIKWLIPRIPKHILSLCLKS